MKEEERNISMPNNLALLIALVKNLDLEPVKAGPITSADLSGAGFARVRFAPIGLIGIKLAGGEAFSDFAESIFNASPAYQRGATYKDLSDRLFGIILEVFFDRRHEIPTQADVLLVEDAISWWFQENSASHFLYIPCRLSPWLARDFNVGPVTFTHSQDFVQQRLAEGVDIEKSEFKPMFEMMGRNGADWIATVEVDNCSKKRAWEIGGLAVDIAIASIQLVIPLDHSSRMARTNGRMSPSFTYAISRSGSGMSQESTNSSPGISMGDGVFQKYLLDGRAVVEAAGRRISAFVDPAQSIMPLLEQAWADAAYWLHEGLAEPLETIAVPKLETAIEVLLRAESTSGSKVRIIKAIDAFYGLSEDESINPHSQVTVSIFAKGFVTDRSRILHGTWSTLTHSLLGSRDDLTALVVGLLIRYALKLDDYMSSTTSTDNIEAFLAFCKTPVATP